jgi:hypothetical protein
MILWKRAGSLSRNFIACAGAALGLVLLASPGGAAKGSFSSADPLDGFFGTVWHCTTFGGTRLTHVFYRTKDDASIVVVTRFLLPNSPVLPSEEFYRYSDRRDQWTARLARGTMIVTAPPWNNGTTWSFNGTAPEGKKAEPVRMTFTVSGDDGFRRDFSREEAQKWTTFAGETCRSAHGR